MKEIQCKRCFFFTPEWCPKKHDSLDPDLIRDCQYFRTKTNADRIRAMSDEEWAKEMYMWGDGAWSYEDWLAWLKEEVKE